MLKTRRIKRESDRLISSGDGNQAPRKKIEVSIPPLEQAEMRLMLIGDRPLLVNNKLNVAEAISDRYSGPGKSAAVAPATVTPDEQYAQAFYVMPDTKHPAPDPRGRYGVPASGIKKCFCKAIRTTGITDNTTIGLIGNSFWIMEDGGGLCLLKFERLEQDVRAVNIGSGAKTVPQMRSRPIFHGWSVELRIKYNKKVIGPDQIVNLAMHAGQYIGLCEMRAEKRQGQCGGFVVKGVE